MKPSKPLPDVQVGQIWEDYDSRTRHHTNRRLLRVDAFEKFIHPDGHPRVICTVLESDRQVVIQVRRFKPTATGYRLIKEVKL